MSKLTNAEKDKLDNTCGNLRVTKLGTHVKSLEDFVNEGALATRANDVTAAINELYAMIVNKDCEAIQIPPPGFFTLWGNDEDGKLYCYYNDQDNPPLFHHVETPGELEGTLYLYIADPEGENNYEMEIGHYIAVRHLDNYYTKAQCDAKYPVTVQKQTNAESGYAATYVVKQNGVQVGSKINIPKDFFLKGGSVKTCTTANQPVQGYVVGDKYLDMEINVNDGGETTKHMYILVKDLADAYTADESTLTLSNANVFSIKNSGVSTAKIANNAVTNAKINSVDASKVTGLATVATSGSYNDLANKPSFPSVVDVVEDGNSNAVTSNAVYDYVRASPPSSHSHGNLQADGRVGTSNNANKNVVTDANGKITSEDKLVVDSALSSTSANPVQNKVINTALESKVSTSDSRLTDARNPQPNKIEASSTNIVDLDSDTYKVAGFYFSSQNAFAYYIKNCPWSMIGEAPYNDNKAFWLMVESWGNNKKYVKQTLTYYFPVVTYVRVCNNGTWSAWKEMTSTGNEEFISSTQTEGSSAWTGTSKRIITLTAGTKIYYWLKTASGTNDVTLNLTLANGNTTGAKNVSPIYLAKRLPAYTMLELIWDGSNWSIANPTIVVNDLTTGGTTSALSAEQGKTLKSLVDGKANSIHNHNLTDITVTTLGINVDFNADEFKTPGFYKISYTNAQTSTNMPQKNGGLLIVRNILNGCSQTFQKYGEATADMWYRTYYSTNDTWSNWKKVSYDDHTHTKSQISDFSHNHGEGFVKDTATRDLNVTCDYNSQTKIAIVRWWKGNIRNVDDNWSKVVATLPVTNAGNDVYSTNIMNSGDANTEFIHFRVRGNQLQARCRDNLLVTADTPVNPGELMFFIE